MPMTPGPAWVPITGPMVQMNRSSREYFGESMSTNSSKSVARPFSTHRSSTSSARARSRSHPSAFLRVRCFDASST